MMDNGTVGAVERWLPLRPLRQHWQCGGSGGGGLLSDTGAGRRDSGGDDSRLSDEDNTMARRGNVEMTRSTSGNASFGQRRGVSRGASGEAGGPVGGEKGGQTAVVGWARAGGYSGGLSEVAGAGGQLGGSQPGSVGRRPSGSRCGWPAGRCGGGVRFSIIQTGLLFIFHLVIALITCIL
jgi:hypothetical protein